LHQLPLISVAARARNQNEGSLLHGCHSAGASSRR
jgi:hypothetical protein